MMKKRLVLMLLSLCVLCTACSDNSSKPEQISVADSTVLSGTVSSDTESNNISLDALCEKILESTEFPAMLKTELAEMLDMIMDFSKYGIKEYSVYQQAMSVHLCEIIIIRTDDVKATMQALENRKDVLIDQLAFYPEQQEAARNTVVGSKNDICYLITHKDAKTAEKVLLRNI
jgi:hypothetical protein